ncbi:hypothetical protein [Bradyrhizobium sp. LMTR 3]|uniref:hypothetical protein n=1 Tax=Bradyrhizobium sp. LMTR 3 TaxID=189873 RepID=UPI00114635E9|nr:hypothetical protein [Bradyrhizobium sp. LMTR 3]
MNANLQLTPVRIDLPLMKPEGWQIMPPVDLASGEGKELKEGPQPMLCDKQRAAFVTKLEHEGRHIDQRGNLRPGKTLAIATTKHVRKHDGRPQIDYWQARQWRHVDLRGDGISF